MDEWLFYQFASFSAQTDLCLQPIKPEDIPSSWEMWFSGSCPEGGRWVVHRGPNISAQAKGNKTVMCLFSQLRKRRRKQRFYKGNRKTNHIRLLWGQRSKTSDIEREQEREKQREKWQGSWLKCKMIPVSCIAVHCLTLTQPDTNQRTHTRMDEEARNNVKTWHKIRDMNRKIIRFRLQILSANHSAQT